MKSVSKILLSAFLLLAMICSLSACSSKTGKEKQPFDPNGYVGTWASEGCSNENGGLILELSLENDVFFFTLESYQGAPYYRVASVESFFPTGKIIGGRTVIEFEDDGFGNHGNINLIFAEERILVSFDNVIMADGALYGLYDGSTFELTRNDSVYDTFYGEESSFDPVEYFGFWATEGCSFDKGGLVMDFDAEIDTVYMLLELYEPSPNNSICSIECPVLCKDLEDNVAVFTYDDDGCGNSGKITVTLNGINIKVEVYDTVPGNKYDAGFRKDATYTLYRNDNIYSYMKE